jgi:hypothetical protein
MYELSLAQRDLYLVSIEEQIKNKREMLMKKQKKLQKIAKENEYIELVRNDYQKYYDYIVKQKQDQINAMNYLNQYVDDIIVNGKLTETDLENARLEQEVLMHEMKNIKDDLDTIIRNDENTNDNDSDDSDDYDDYDDYDNDYVDIGNYQEYKDDALSDI